MFPKLVRREILRGRYKRAAKQYGEESHLACALHGRLQYFTEGPPADQEYTVESIARNRQAGAEGLWNRTQRRKRTS